MSLKDSVSSNLVCAEMLMKGRYARHDDVYLSSMNLGVEARERGFQALTQLFTKFETSMNYMKLFFNTQR